MERADSKDYSGLLKKAFARDLVKDFPDCFTFQSENANGQMPVVSFASSMQALSFEQKTAQLATVTASLRDRGIIKGWRDELLPFTASFSSPPLLLIERAAAPFFGLKAYGVHVNGYVREPSTGAISHIWVGRRAKVNGFNGFMYVSFPCLHTHLLDQKHLAEHAGSYRRGRHSFRSECYGERGQRMPRGSEHRGVFGIYSSLCRFALVPF